MRPCCGRWRGRTVSGALGTHKRAEEAFHPVPARAWRPPVLGPASGIAVFVNIVLRRNSHPHAITRPDTFYHIFSLQSRASSQCHSRELPQCRRRHSHRESLASAPDPAKPRHPHAPRPQAKPAQSTPWVLTQFLAIWRSPPLPDPGLEASACLAASVPARSEFRTNGITRDGLPCLGLSCCCCSLPIQC